jgi:GNAT superfamily N-acetyltransferase
MRTPPWHEEAISRKHDRESFDCGEPALNDFLRQHARQSHERGAAKTFVAVSDQDRRKVLGYYSLSPASIEFSRAPDPLRKRLPRHDVPVFRLARLAVQRQMQGQGLGGHLLLSAGRRCLLAATEVGGVALLIDAKNERVAAWYSSRGAMPLLDAPLTLVLPLTTIKTALEAAGRL